MYMYPTNDLLEEISHKRSYYASWLNFLDETSTSQTFLHFY